MTNQWAVVTRLPPPKDYMAPIHKAYGPFPDRKAAEHFSLQWVRDNACGIAIVEPLHAPEVRS